MFKKGEKIMNSLNLILIICIIASLSVLLRKNAPEYSLIINIATGLLVITYLISNFLPIFNYIKNLINVAKISEKYSSILFKSLGICFLSQFASDSCKDAGEESLASKVEIVGKITIISIAIPLFEEVTKTALEFIGAK